MIDNTQKIILLNCPFCGGDDIRYSTKVTHGGRKLQYHASYYCNKCHCYGPRVLSNQVDQYDYFNRKEMEASMNLQENAALKWNKRS